MSGSLRCVDGNDGDQDDDDDESEKGPAAGRFRLRPSAVHFFFSLKYSLTNEFAKI
jgi:hypothetical protein